MCCQRPSFAPSCIRVLLGCTSSLKVSKAREEKTVSERWVAEYDVLVSGRALVEQWPALLTGQRHRVEVTEAERHSCTTTPPAPMNYHVDDADDDVHWTLTLTSSPASSVCHTTPHAGGSVAEAWLGSSVATCDCDYVAVVAQAVFKSAVRQPDTLTQLITIATPWLLPAWLINTRIYTCVSQKTMLHAITWTTNVSALVDVGLCMWIIKLTSQFFDF